MTAMLSPEEMTISQRKSIHAVGCKNTILKKEVSALTGLTSSNESLTVESLSMTPCVGSGHALDPVFYHAPC